MSKPLLRALLNTRLLFFFLFFFFNATATTEIYTLSLHDALPIYLGRQPVIERQRPASRGPARLGDEVDRKSTRLNSSHRQISYAVFGVKKKKWRAVADGKGRGKKVQEKEKGGGETG